ncbi:MAG: hypothetical protein KDI41_12345, partial [Pseudomonadales bacterium]|nr:hypothetical protein [Pseudomonadales bacterium]
VIVKIKFQTPCLLTQTGGLFLCREKLQHAWPQQAATRALRAQIHLQLKSYKYAQLFCSPRTRIGAVIF